MSLETYFCRLVIQKLPALIFLHTSLVSLRIPKMLMKPTRNASVKSRPTFSDVYAMSRFQTRGKNHGIKLAGLAVTGIAMA